MKKTLFLIPALVCLLSFLNIRDTSPGNCRETLIGSKDNVSFYSVPLVCPAAPSIGCGSESKPILMEFEKDLNISGAWLNRTGTEIAIEWKEGLSSDERKSRAKSVFDKYAVNYEEISGASFDKSLESFLSGKDWYKGADVDKLSEEESWVIADKVVVKLKSKVDLSAEKENKLKSDISEVCKTQFFAAGSEASECDTEQAVSDFYAKAGAYLNAKEIKELKSIVKSMFKGRECRDDCCKDKKRQ